VVQRRLEVGRCRERVPPGSGAEFEVRAGAPMVCEPAGGNGSHGRSDRSHEASRGTGLDLVDYQFAFRVRLLFAASLLGGKLGFSESAGTGSYLLCGAALSGSGVRAEGQV